MKRFNNYLPIPLVRQVRPAELKDEVGYKCKEYKRKFNALPGHTCLLHEGLRYGFVKELEYIIDLFIHWNAPLFTPSWLPWKLAQTKFQWQLTMLNVCPVTL